MPSLTGRGLLVLVCLVVTMTLVHGEDIFQTQAQALLTRLETESMDAVLFWNLVAMQACANDYDSEVTDTPEHIGPATTSRAFAIIHGAIFEAMNAFDKVYPSMFKIDQVFSTKNVRRTPAIKAAIAESAYQTLIALYTKQLPLFDAVATGYRTSIGDSSAIQAAIRKGATIGKTIATTILRSRSLDNSQLNVTYTPIMAPGYHQPDPTRADQGVISPQWGSVKPFFLYSTSQFRAPNFVGKTIAARRRYINSQRYIDDYNEIVSYGSRVSELRTEDQTEIGIFWGYDAAPKIGVPPRLYNQVARAVAIQSGNTLQDNARLFALVNYALADAAISAWETKYRYNFWRPIVGIRQGSTQTAAIPDWLPLGAQADGAGDNFTPAFPSYTSGHATLGGATFQMLRLFYGNDSVSFSLGSDEFNGITVDSISGQPRPVRTRNYSTFTEADEENRMSRIYLGVHWPADTLEGQQIGHNVASYIFERAS